MTHELRGKKKGGKERASFSRSEVGKVGKRKRIRSTSIKTRIYIVIGQSRSGKRGGRGSNTSINGKEGVVGTRRS